MTVEKFGGAVLRTPQGFEAMTSIVRSLQPAPCLVVVSAIGSTTRDLAEAARCAQSGSGGEASSILDAIASHHADLASALIREPSALRHLIHAMSEILDATRRLCRSVAVTRQCSARTLDRIMAAGEDLARIIAVAVLRSASLPVQEVDARSLIVTDDTYGMARPEREATRIRVQHLVSRSSLISVTQGFVASTESGNTTTMGRESSNLSAALLASCMDATSVTIWTDVPGVQTADPTICPHARAVPYLKYEHARIAAAYGLKLLYPTMIEPAQQAGIPVRIASAMNPGHSGTRIDSAEVEAPTMIASVDHGQTAQVTMLFVSMEQCLRACNRVQSELTSDATPIAFDIATHMHERAATIVLPSLHAAHVVRILHNELCEQRT